MQSLLRDLLLGGGNAPSLNFNFVDGSPFPGQITFTRASSATRFNSSGVLETVGNDVARLDFDPATLAPLGLLIEEQRTNQLRWSEDSSQWLTPVNATLTQNATTAPDGTNTADQMLETTAVGLHSQEATDYVFVAGTAYTYSVFVKSISGRNFEIGFPVGFSTSRFARFDLATGAVQGTDSGVSATIIAFPNGWYRCIATSTCVTGGGARPANFINNSAFVRSYTGNTSSGIFVWGIQLEAGAFPTSYIPTTTAAVTRAADVASVNTLTPWFNAAQGTLFMEFAVPQLGRAARIIAVDDGSFTNMIDMTVSVANAIAIEAVAAGVYGGFAVASGSIVANTPQKAASTFSTSSDETVCLNAGTTGAGAVTLPSATLTRLLLGRQSNGVELCGHIRRITYYPRRLSDAQLQQITA